MLTIDRWTIVKMLFRSSIVLVSESYSMEHWKAKVHPHTKNNMHQGKVERGWAAVLLGSNRHPGRRHM